MTTVELGATNDAKVYEQILDQCTCLQIKKSARTLTNLYDRALLKSNINSGQLSILLKIEALDSPTLNVLADQLNLKSSTMSRALSPLERDGLISLATGTDKRTRKVQVSPKGKKAIEIAIPLWKQAQNRVENALGAFANNELKGYLDVISKLPY